MVTIDRERLTSEKQNNTASAEGARLPKGAMLLKDIFKYIYIYFFFLILAIALISRKKETSIIKKMKFIHKIEKSRAKQNKTVFDHFIVNIVTFIIL